MSLPRYGEYTDSGERWLGAVPAHWQVHRLKRLFEIRKRIVGEEGHQVLSITQRGIKVKDIEGNDGQLSMDYSKYQVVHPGDFAMNHMDLLTGFVDISPYAGVTSPDYRVFGVRDGVACEPRYFLYLLQNCYRQKVFYAFGQGASEFGRWRFPTDQFNDFRFPCPPPGEQTIIAGFLDRETAKIDALLAEQERLITVLAEKRQATISHAVTKGLNPKALMKDSGVAWLGEVPAHWEVTRVKNVARLESGHTPSKQFPEYWEDCDIPWVSLNDSKHLAAHDYISDTAVKINALGLANSSARMLPAGAVVFTRDATIGLAAITTLPMAVSQHLIAWCPSERITTLFLLRIFNAMKPHLESHTFGATIKTIGMADVKKLVTSVPPLDEQRAITTHIASETGKFDALRQDAERAVALLNERRSALIAAAVTGQIDVRSA